VIPAKKFWSTLIRRTREYEVGRATGSKRRRTVGTFATHSIPRNVVTQELMKEMSISCDDVTAAAAIAANT